MAVKSGSPCPALQRALQAASCGWRVHPLHAGSKRPRLKGWQKEATTNANQIRRWAGQYPQANFGVVCEDGGPLVIDIDGDPGRMSLSQAEQEFGPLPPTLTIRTPRGEHRYFTNPGGIKRAVGWRPGLDVLSSGYAVLPGALVEGRTYSLVGEADLDRALVAELPAEWSEATGKLRRTQRATETACVDLCTSLCVSVSDSDPEGVLRVCKVTTLGQSNEVFFRLIRGLKHNCRLSRADAEQWVEKWFQANHQQMSGDHDLDHFLDELPRRWDAARWTLGTNVLQLAIDEAAHIELPPQIKSKCEGTRRLASVCVALARTTGGVFSLSVTQAAQVLFGLPVDSEPRGTERSTASKRLKAMSNPRGRYGASLEVVEKGVAGHAGGRATRWRLGPDLLPCLQTESGISLPNGTNAERTPSGD